MVAEKSLEAWAFVRKMLADMTDLITQDARDERELLEGLRVLNRVATLCTELSLDSDTDHPHFVEMSTPYRMMSGGPNPHGFYPWPRSADTVTIASPARAAPRHTWACRCSPAPA